MEPLQLVPNLIEQVHGRLVDAIAAGDLAPGERLTQEDVAARLQVSRQPVSHALQLLKRQGLVVEAGRRRLVVAGIEPARIRGLYQIRAALDGLAARLAAGRADRGELHAALAAGRGLGPGAPIGDWIAADVAFHAALHRLSGNAALVDMVAEQWPHFKRCMGLVLSEPEQRRLVWQEHAAIVECVAAGDAQGAERAAREHTERAGAELIARLETRDDAA